MVFRSIFTKILQTGESFWNFLNLIEYDQSVFRIDFLSRIDLNAAKDTLRIKICRKQFRYSGI